MLKKFRINKLSACVISIALLVSQMVFAPAVSAASTTYEAENAALSGGAIVGTDHTGYTGTGFVEGYTDGNKGNANTTFSVSASSAGSYTTTLRYSNGSGSSQTLSLYVNGTKIKQISLGTTSDWNTWATEQETVSLNSGSNTISYKFDSTDSGNVNLDNTTIATSLGTNLAAGKSISCNNNISGYPATNANDSNTSTYWEGAANSYPNTLTVDLGSQYSINNVVVQLPGGWGSRTQTFSILGSTDGTNYSTMVSSNVYTFDPSSNNNTVTISVSSITARYVELYFTANSGATGGQAAEFQVYGTSLSQCATPTFSPGTGTYSSAQTVTISDGTSGATIHYTTDGSTPTDASPTYSSPISVPSTETLNAIAAKSGMSDSAVGSATYTISFGTNIALGKTIICNNYYSGFPATNANDNNTSSYWEGAANSYPNTLTVDLGSTYTVTTVSVLLPVSGWGTRTQTFSVLGSTDGTTYNTIVSSAQYTFDPNTNNTVNITFTGTVERYLELNFTANSGSTAGQVGEFQVYGTSISQAATPTFSPAGGSYQTTQSVTLSDTTTGAVIHYTTDGSTPTASSATYSSAIQVSSTETINAIAIASGYANSNVGSATYTICPATPTFSPGSGTYSSAQTVTISDSTQGTTIHYTTDGSTPTDASPTYSSPISVPSTETVNAIAAKSGMSDSAVGTATYTINIAGTVTYEAENAFYYGGVGVSTQYSGYQGTGYLNNWTTVGDKVIFSANSPSAGNYSVTLRYSNGNASAKTLSVYANGIFVLQTTLNSTSNWTTWAVKSETIPLRAGMNTITYQYTSSDSGNVDVDNMAITSTIANATRGATLPYQEYEAENGTTNATITSYDTTYHDIASEASGRKAVELTSTGNYVTITLTAPANSLVIRYCIPDASGGGGITAPLSLYINGTKNQDVH